MPANHSLVDEFLASDSAQQVSRVVDAHPSLPVYRLQFPSEHEVANAAQEWARQLFVNCQFNDARPSPTVHANRLVLQHPGGYRVRAFHASNWLDFKDTRRAFRGATDVTELDVADRLVREFMARHQLLPGDWENQVRPDEVRLLRGQGTSADAALPPVVINCLLSYRRLTGGIDWIGPGAQIVATIEGREVVAFDRPWRELDPEPVTAVDIRPLREVLQELEDKLTGLRGKPIPPGTFKLDRIDFGYYAMGKHAQQRFLQPAYEIMYRTNGPIFAALAEIIPAHAVSIEPLAVAPAAANSPHKHRPAPPSPGDCRPQRPC